MGNGQNIFLRAIKAILRWPVKFSMKHLEKGDHVTRYYMYDHLSRVFDGLDAKKEGVKILSVSRSRRLCQVFRLKRGEITEANYPEYNIIDLPFDDNFFDYAGVDEVIEHVEANPQDAVDEIYRVLKPGGVAIFTTCLIHPVHGEPKDFWRFTPDALALLSRKFSSILDCGGWGNIWVWLVDWLGLKYEPVPHAVWHPMHVIAVQNNEKWPIVTWIVAKK
ncbi:MAG: class I SAM-dependent methyltransferase [Candidatus Omnitrophica bacterium]|nr:class I SAM-dependent methyltransferase [Candidatus Omnitrophota bacterium]